MTDQYFMAAMRIGIPPLPAPVALRCLTCDHINHYVCAECEAREDAFEQHQEQR